MDDRIFNPKVGIYRGATHDENYRAAVLNAMADAKLGVTGAHVEAPLHSEGQTWPKAGTHGNRGKTLPS